MSPAAAATLWLLNGDLVSEAGLASLVATLGLGERERYARFLRPQRAREFLLGRLLLRHAAQSLLGVAAADIVVTEREGNAPLLELSAAHASPDFYFSLSHSRGWIGCVATTVCHIGIDLESKDRSRNIDELSAAAFSEEEQAWLARLPARERERGFYRLWNGKEALHKWMSSRGKMDSLLPSLIDADGNFRDSGDGGHHVFLLHAYLFLAICSSQPIHDVRLIEHAECERLIFA